MRLTVNAGTTILSIAAHWHAIFDTMVKHTLFGHESLLNKSGKPESLSPQEV